MRQINRNRIGSKPEVLPKLTASMIPSSKCVLTFVNAGEVNGVNGAFLLIDFAEFDGYQMLTNAGQEDALLALVDAGILPEDMDQWPGQRVAFYKKKNTNPTTGERVEKLYACPAADQKRVIEQFDAGDFTPGKEKAAAAKKKS